MATVQAGIEVALEWPGYECPPQRVAGRQHEKNNSIMAYPNPAINTEDVTVAINVEEAGIYNLNLLDINGNRIETILENTALPLGLQEYTIKHRGTGMFFIHLTDGSGHSQLHKLLKF